MALSVKIQKKLGSFALNVSFEVKNEILALLGASGSGKSMTLKCIAGIETPDTGRIVLNDRVLFDSDAKINLPPQKRHVGYMFQDYALFPHMTVTKNIMAGMGKRPDEKVVRDYLKRFQLEGLEERIPAQLSGGQKQRVAMARMLAAQPEVILLDEPFSALDSYLRWELESEMKKCLKAVKKPVLFVSHDRDEVFRLCDTVCCIDRGHTHPAETVREFFENPKTRAAARLSGCKNFSRVRRLDEHHLEALDWKVVLQVQREIPADVKGVGIRAHSFQAGRGESFDNHFPVTEAVVQEDLFEWNVAFKPSADSSYLQWKFEKNDANAKGMKIPSFLSVSSNRILLLSDDGTDGWE